MSPAQLSHSYQHVDPGSQGGVRGRTTFRDAGIDLCWKGVHASVLAAHSEQEDGRTTPQEKNPRRKVTIRLSPSRFGGMVQWTVSQVGSLVWLVGVVCLNRQSVPGMCRCRVWRVPPPSGPPKSNQGRSCGSRTRGNRAKP